MLFGSLDTAKLDERAAVRSSMTTLQIHKKLDVKTMASLVQHASQSHIYILTEPKLFLFLTYKNNTRYCEV